MIKSFYITPSVVFLLMSSVCFYAFSEEQKTPGGNPVAASARIELTASDVERCVKLLPYFLKNLKTPPEKQDIAGLNSLAQANGFKTYPEFLKTASTVLKAYSYLKLRANAFLLSEKIKKLPPDKAAIFEKSMNSIRKTISAYEKQLSPVTVKAVIPYITRIDAAMNRGNTK